MTSTFKIKGQLVRSYEWKQTDITDCIFLPTEAVGKSAGAVYTAEREKMDSSGSDRVLGRAASGQLSWTFDY